MRALRYDSTSIGHPINEASVDSYTSARARGRLFRLRRVSLRPRASRRLPDREPGTGARGAASQLSLRRAAAVSRASGLHGPRDRQSCGWMRTVPARAPSRSRRSADRSHVRPWRCCPRLRRTMAQAARSLVDHHRGRPLVRTRHGRQQGPAYDQSRCARERARVPRWQARIQRHAALRNR